MNRDPLELRSFRKSRLQVILGNTGIILLFLSFLIEWYFDIFIENLKNFFQRIWQKIGTPIGIVLAFSTIGTAFNLIWVQFLPINIARKGFVLFLIFIFIFFAMSAVQTPKKVK